MDISSFKSYASRLEFGNDDSSKVVVELLSQLDPHTDDFACAVALITREPFDSIGVGKATVRNAAANSLPTTTSDIRSEESRVGSLPHAIGSWLDTHHDSPFGGTRTEHTLGDLYRDIEYVRDTSGRKMKRRIQNMLSEYMHPRWAAHALLGKKGVSFGIGEKSVVSALCDHHGVDNYRRALALNPDVIDLCRSIVDDGIRVRGEPEIGKPFLPMLAKSKDVTDDTETRIVQPKYDGARIIVHIRDGDIVGAWSRNGKERTDSLPELTSVAQEVPDDGEFILDGEAIPYEDGEQKSFRHVMTRIGRQDDIDKQNIDIEFKFFDCIYACDSQSDICIYNEDVMVNRKRIRERIWVLNNIVPEFAVESKFVSGDNIVEEYRSFVDQGYEGAVVKETGKDTEYKFNKRSSDWRKMIPEHEHIDLRITAVQEGEDSMSGSVGSITVETSDGYELGNVTESLPGTSGTDWDNRRTIIGEIVEVSWRELQVNDDGTEYSLRFPSLEGYRDDKTSADSLSRVQSLM